MLCQFTFKNFRSYRDETILDMQAASIDEFGNSLLCNDGDSKKFLPVSAIYGPNGGGKSNVLGALVCLISLVMHPIVLLEKNKHPFDSMRYLDYKPFLFDEESAASSTDFKVFFRVDGYEYKYILRVKSGEVLEEFLYRKTIGGKRTATIFERSNGNILLGSMLSRGGYNTDVNVKMPYLSFLAINYDIPAIASAVKWFECSTLINYANPNSELYLTLVNIEQYKKVLISMFHKMDIHIDDYRINPIDKDNNRYEIFVQKNINNHIYELNFTDESDGTKKLLGLLPRIILSLQEGGLLVIDELDAKLQHSYAQAIAGEGRLMSDVFDDLERSLK